MAARKGLKEQIFPLSLARSLLPRKSPSLPENNTLLPPRSGSLFVSPWRMYFSLHKGIGWRAGREGGVTWTSLTCPGCSYSLSNSVHRTEPKGEDLGGQASWESKSRSPREPIAGSIAVWDLAVGSGRVRAEIGPISKKYSEVRILDGQHGSGFTSSALGQGRGWVEGVDHQCLAEGRWSMKLSFFLSMML